MGGRLVAFLSKETPPPQFESSFLEIVQKYENNSSTDCKGLGAVVSRLLAGTWWNWSPTCNSQCQQVGGSVTQARMSRVWAKKISMCRMPTFPSLSEWLVNRLFTYWGIDASSESNWKNWTTVMCTHWFIGLINKMCSSGVISISHDHSKGLQRIRHGVSIHVELRLYDIHWYMALSASYF